MHKSRSLKQGLWCYSSSEIVLVLICLGGLVIINLSGTARSSLTICGYPAYK